MLAQEHQHREAGLTNTCRNHIARAILMLNPPMRVQEHRQLLLETRSWQALNASASKTSAKVKHRTATRAHELQREALQLLIASRLEAVMKHRFSAKH